MESHVQIFKVSAPMNFGAVEQIQQVQKVMVLMRVTIYTTRLAYSYRLTFFIQILVVILHNIMKQIMIRQAPE